MWIGVLWTAAAVCLPAPAQAPVVGDINLYGLRTIAPERILSAIQVKPGEPLPPSKGDLEDRIADVPGVALARVEAVCCDGRNATLFIGIEERGAPHPDLRSGPAGDATLPQDLVDLYNRFLIAVQRAAGGGAASEDLTAGHSVMADPDARALQDRFGEYAAVHLDVLRAVLRSDPEPNERAIAAAVIGYAPRKAEIVNDLQLAVRDPDESVRANALRALNAVAVLASKQPALGLRIDPTWAIELLHSVFLSDRVESVKLLLTLTDRGAATVLDQIRASALHDVVEMARWKTASYALPPFLLAGRLSGMSDRQVQQAWQKGDRDAVLQKLPPPKH
jgi:HEAT repeats